MLHPVVPPGPLCFVQSRLQHRVDLENFSEWQTLWPMDHRGKVISTDDRVGGKRAGDKSLLGAKLAVSHAISLSQRGSSSPEYRRTPCYPDRPHAWERHPALPFKAIQIRTKLRLQHPCSHFSTNKMVTSDWKYIQGFLKPSTRASLFCGSWNPSPLPCQTGEGAGEEEELLDREVPGL